MENIENLKLVLRNEMCRLEEMQDCCSELEHDELEIQLCDVETAYIHLDRGIALTSKDHSIINNLKGS